MLVGVWINYQWPGDAFTYVVSFATISGMWAWIMILISQIRYRRMADAGMLPQSSFRAPGAPYTSWFALLFIGMVIVMMAIDADARISLYCAPLWALILFVSYRVLQARTPDSGKTPADTR